MEPPENALFNDHLMQRYQACLDASPAERGQIAADIMRRCGFAEGREGTSGAANAYLIFISTEFGNAAPRWSGGDIDAQGWADLWRLRIGERNPHFARERSLFRENRSLWRNLYAQLPNAFGNAEMGYSITAWANLAEGTSTAASQGMDPALARFIQASGARVVVAAKKQAWPALQQWANAAGGVRVAVAGMNEAQLATVGSRKVIAAYLGGHPSHWNQFMSSTDFVRRVKSLIALAEKHAA